VYDILVNRRGQDRDSEARNQRNNRSNNDVLEGQKETQVGSELRKAEEHEVYTPAWEPHLKKAGYRGGVMVTTDRQSQAWSRLIGEPHITSPSYYYNLPTYPPLGEPPLPPSTSCSNIPIFPSSITPSSFSNFSPSTSLRKDSSCSNFSSSPSSEMESAAPKYEPWTWRSHLENIQEEKEMEKEEFRRNGPRKSILKKKKSMWEVSLKTLENNKGKKSEASVS